MRSYYNIGNKYIPKHKKTYQNMHVNDIVTKNNFVSFLHVNPNVV